MDQERDEMAESGSGGRSGSRLGQGLGAITQFLI